MERKYQISGMTCTSCEEKVKENLLSSPYITFVEVSKESNSATVTMDKLLITEELQTLLGGRESKYQIKAIEQNVIIEENISWFETYKPIVLIFGYITFVTVVVQFKNNHFDMMQWMQHFMAGFFLVFSFFKFINLKGFVESYKMYDVIAKRIPIWAYIYAFVEFGLGAAYLFYSNSLIINLVTFIVMSISIIGVLQSILNKKKIQCACLGAIFNLPMSMVTVIEDGLMIIMSLIMLFMLQ